VADGVSASEGVSEGLTVASSTAVGEGEGLGVGVDLGDGFAEGFGEGEVFDVFLCFGDGEGDDFECFFGRGVGVAKSSFILWPNDSSSSFTAFAGSTMPRRARIARRTRLFRFILNNRLGCKFLQNRLVHPDSSIEILERETFVRRMCPASRQGQADQ
jgi:hypothetical protein